MTFTLLIIERNEIDGMKAVLPRIRKDWVDEIIIIDGNSTDGSAEYARSLGFRVIAQKNFKPTGPTPLFFPRHATGVVEALKEGLAAASGDYVITFTPDNNCVPELIPNLVEILRNESCDMAVVSRYLGSARSIDDTFWTHIGNHGITWLVNKLFRSKYTDVMVIFRGYRRNLVQELGIDLKLSFHTELSIRCATRRKKVIEIPGDEPARLGGQSIRQNFKNGAIELEAIAREFWRQGSS